MKNTKGNNIYEIRDAHRKIKKHQRQMQVRRNIAMLSLFVTLTLMASVLFVSISSQAGNVNDDMSCKYFKSIQIEKGDTLWSIANENMDIEHYSNASEYVKEVKSINSLASDRIVAGNYIIVPYYSENIYANAAN